MPRPPHPPPAGPAPANARQQHGVAGLADGLGLRGVWVAGGVDGGAADEGGGVLQLLALRPRRLAQHLEARVGDLRADAIARQHRNLVRGRRLGRQGRANKEGAGWAAAAGGCSGRCGCSYIAMLPAFNDYFNLMQTVASPHLHTAALGSGAAGAHACWPRTPHCDGCLHASR
jgi:hypothetical protein